MARIATYKTCRDNAQDAFNAYIRARDAVCPIFKGLCIGCLKRRVFLCMHFLNKHHYSGSCFDEENAHGGCYYCNRRRGGNLIEYRINLIKKRGIKVVEKLEKNRKKKKTYTKAMLIAIKEEFILKLAKLTAQEAKKKK